MFFVVIPLSSCREPLAIGGEGTAAVASSGSEPAKEISGAQSADPPLEPAKAAAEVAKDTVAPPEALPLVVDLEPQAAGDDDAAMADAFEVAPRLGTGGEGGSFLLPSSVVEESAKDHAMAVVTSSLPGPRQATLECTPPYSGPSPDRLDASGRFPLAVLMEKRAKEQLADVTLLRSSVEYALGNAAKEIAVLKRELDAAKCTVLSSCRLRLQCSRLFLLSSDLLLTPIR